MHRSFECSDEHNADVRTDSSAPDRTTKLGTVAVHCCELHGDAVHRDIIDRRTVHGRAIHRHSEREPDRRAIAAAIRRAHGSAISCAVPMWLRRWQPLHRSFECSDEHNADVRTDSSAPDRTTKLGTVAGTLAVTDNFALSCAYDLSICCAHLLSDQSHVIANICSLNWCANDTCAFFCGNISANRDAEAVVFSFLAADDRADFEPDIY